MLNSGEKKNILTCVRKKNSERNKKPFFCKAIPELGFYSSISKQQSTGSLTCHSTWTCYLNCLHLLLNIIFFTLHVHEKSILEIVLFQVLM